MPSYVKLQEASQTFWELKSPSPSDDLIVHICSAFYGFYTLFSKIIEPHLWNCFNFPKHIHQINWVRHHVERATDMLSKTKGKSSYGKLSMCHSRCSVIYVKDQTTYNTKQMTWWFYLKLTQEQYNWEILNKMVDGDSSGTTSAALADQTCEGQTMWYMGTPTLSLWPRYLALRPYSVLLSLPLLIVLAMRHFSSFKTTSKEVFSISLIRKPQTQINLLLHEC